MAGRDQSRAQGNGAGDKNDARLELVADGFSFPTSVAFDDHGVAHVAESGLPFGGAAPGGRVWRVGRGGEKVLLEEGFAPPVNGLTFHDDGLYLSEGGRGCISRLEPGGRRTVVLKDLPGPGNYHTNMVAFGPDRKLYFSQGAMTNTGIVGLDAYELGWLARLPHAHDIPGYGVVLSGVNVETPNPLSGRPGDVVETGGFAPFGTRTEAGRRIPGRTPATAAVMRCNPDGSDLELVAWGLRNAYGLGFLPDGRMLATDQGPDDRGSRPVGNAPDLLFELREGAWYGWPDFIGGDPIIDERYLPERGPAPSFLLANHHELPPPEPPLLRFPAHSAAVKFDAAPPHRPGAAASLFVALFGDEAPMTAPAGPRVGRGVVRVDLEDRSLDVVVSGAPLARPIDVRFHDGGLYILDFGKFEMAERGLMAKAGTGKLWRLLQE